jgi:tetratricopeptide (TPR) repeat protein
MKAYLPDLLEEAWATLSKKYGFVPTGRVRVDCFHRSDDFSVRSVGVPGLPALGVCFGNVITLLGPTSEPVGAFSWSRTAWHEFAHVITLGESKGQVPRWLTEGLSVYEEKARRSDWSREMQLQLYNRWRNGHLLKMAEINSAFRGPDIGFAYFQGGLIAEQLIASRGFDVIPSMLREFAKDRTTAQVFHDVLSIDLDDYDRVFDDYVKGLVGDYRIEPRWDAESEKAFAAQTQAHPDDGRAWARLGWAHLQRQEGIDAGVALAAAKRLLPDDPEVILLEGRLAEVNGRADLAEAAYRRFLDAGGDDVGVRLFLAQRALDGHPDAKEAVTQLEAAKRCFPLMTGKASPYLQLAKLYQGAGETEKAVAELEAYAHIAPEDYGVRKQLLSWYRSKEDWKQVARLCSELNDITPFGANRGQPPDLDLHRAWADALLRLGRKDEAIRELTVQVDLIGTLPEEKRVEAGGVQARLDLGDLLLEAGRPLDALEQAVAALRLAPQDAGALMLKGRAEEAAGYR